SRPTRPKGATRAARPSHLLPGTVLAEIISEWSERRLVVRPGFFLQAFSLGCPIPAPRFEAYPEGSPTPRSGRLDRRGWVPHGNQPGFPAHPWRRAEIRWAVPQLRPCAGLR